MGEDQGEERGPELVTLLGGPLDGERVDVTGWSQAERAAGVALPAGAAGAYPGGRCCYGPPQDEPLAAVWRHEGDVP